MRRMKNLMIVLVLMGLAACTFPIASPQIGPLMAPSTPLAPQPIWQDVQNLLEGVCLSWQLDQVGREFVIADAHAHIAFYNEVDESGLCRFPVARNPFDFEQGAILIGAFNIGTGCTATAEPLALVVDHDAQTVTMQARWGVSGECDYRLSRPLWLSIPRPPEGYTVQFQYLPLE